jgi:hypothetical protein
VVPRTLLPSLCGITSTIQSTAANFGTQCRGHGTAFSGPHSAPGRSSYPSVGTVADFTGARYPDQSPGAGWLRRPGTQARAARRLRSPRMLPLPHRIWQNSILQHCYVQRSPDEE